MISEGVKEGGKRRRAWGRKESEGEDSEDNAKREEREGEDSEDNAKER